jgi:hypothetical protein
MKIRDIYGNKVDIYQARSGGIFMNWGNGSFLLTKVQSEKFSLYDIEDFDNALYSDFYNALTKSQGVKK